MIRFLCIILLNTYILTINANSVHGTGFSIKCSVCHLSEDSTKIETNGFNHDSTGFVLQGKHQSVKCKSCHTDLVFKNQKSDCISCHKNIHENEQLNNCADCHNEAGWKKIKFDHNKTVFPLEGKHKTTSCNKCHSENYSNTSTECVSCHLEDFNSANNPIHASKKFSMKCQECHTADNWETKRFNHTKYTNFALKGKHSNVDCIKCHNNQYMQTKSECVDCHLEDYNNTKKINHKTAGLQFTCNDCHNENNWLPATFNHNSGTNFPLNGMHAKTKCTNCHNKDFSNTPTECVSCHLKDYMNTINPDHVKAEFSKDCHICHNTTSRSPSKFDHNKYSNFQIKGAHVKVQCKTCHTNGYRGRSTACVSCHLKDYKKTKSPKHSEVKFSDKCEKCHSDKDWNTLVFNHDTDTNFPLKDGHAKLSCNACHTKVYKGTSTECVDCHLKEYNSTTKPSHSAFKYPTECTRCHTTVSWTKTSFVHDIQHFPIFSSKHKDVWSDCTACHLNASNFAIVTCTKCHEHSDSEKLARRHRRVANYSTNSSDCYSCHPKGRRR